MYIAPDQVPQERHHIEQGYLEICDFSFEGERDESLINWRTRLMLSDY